MRTAGCSDAGGVAVTSVVRLESLQLGQGIASVGAFPLAWVPALQFPGHRAGVFFVGVAVLISGAFCAATAGACLGCHLPGMSVRAPNRRSFREALRHPSHTAGILINTGIGIALGSWASAGIRATAQGGQERRRLIVADA
jgi:hypothetical protein